MSPLLVNRYEIKTDAALTKVAARNGVRVCEKVRVADALHVSRSGLSDNEFHYALRAHFDFLIVEGISAKPVFAVEFDGPRHGSDPGVILHDSMKDSICTKLGLPLLRIDAAYLRSADKWGTVLGWLVTIWYLERASSKAQERGDIPPDEDFSHNGLFELQPDGSLEPFAIVDQAGDKFSRAARLDITTADHPEVVFNIDEVDGYLWAYAILPLTGGGYIWWRSW